MIYFTVYTCQLQLFYSVVYSYVYLSDSYAGHQGSSLSDPRKTTGFGPFKLPTCGPLQKGQDHSLPKACFEEPSTRKTFVLFIYLFFFSVLSLHIFSLFSYV